MAKGNTKNPGGTLSALFDNLKAGAANTPAARWVSSDAVSVQCREWEVERLEEEGEIIGGLS